MRLHLAVQYASARASPTRARLRRWVRAAMTVLHAADHGGDAIDDASFTIRLVDEAEGRALNRQFRGKDYATNVLTFGGDERSGGAVAADIVICMPVVEAEASAQRKSPGDHCGHLVVHGVLHACGFDHESASDAETMEALERVVLARFGIGDPYRPAR